MPTFTTIYQCHQSYPFLPVLRESARYVFFKGIRSLSRRRTLFSQAISLKKAWVLVVERPLGFPPVPSSRCAAATRRISSRPSPLTSPAIGSTAPAPNPHPRALAIAALPPQAPRHRKRIKRRPDTAVAGPAPPALHGQLQCAVSLAVSPSASACSGGVGRVRAC